MKQIYAIATLVALGASMLVSCNTNETLDSQMDAAPATRAAGDVKHVVYIEVNDINPLNAQSYDLVGGQKFFDIVILFAANINGVNGEAVLHFNDNVTHVLNNVDQYVRPLQANGQKVLLSILGNHTGLGFANLNDAQVEAFAQKLANVVDTYGLDGIDFDDEWAKYGQNGYPNANGTSYAKLVNRLREIMPGKLVTVFDWGYSNTLAAAAGSIDYAWYGAFSNTYVSTGSNISGLPLSKYAGMAMDVKNMSTLYNTYYTRNAQTSVNNGYGAILFYDLRTTNISAMLSKISQVTRGTDTEYARGPYSKNWSGGGPTTDI